MDSKRRKPGMVMGDNVQTVNNSVINVGTIIGNNVFIGSSAIVNCEITPQTTIL